jgi:hypothetical protein
MGATELPLGILLPDPSCDRTSTSDVRGAIHPAVSDTGGSGFSLAVRTPGRRAFCARPGWRPGPIAGNLRHPPIMGGLQDERRRFEPSVVRGPVRCASMDLLCIGIPMVGK